MNGRTTKHFGGELWNETETLETEICETEENRRNLVEQRGRSISDKAHSLIDTHLLVNVMQRLYTYTNQSMCTRFTTDRQANDNYNSGHLKVHEHTRHRTEA